MVVVTSYYIKASLLVDLISDDRYSLEEVRASIDSRFSRELVIAMSVVRGIQLLVLLKPIVCQYGICSRHPKGTALFEPRGSIVSYFPLLRCSIIF